MRPKEERPSTALGERSDNPKRVPIQGRRDVLSVRGQEPGWHYCWVNDRIGGDEGNIDRYLEGGYEFVEHAVIIGDRKIDSASRMGNKISKAVGNGVTAYLMRCPEEVYQEELALMNEDAWRQTTAIEASLNAKEEGKYGKVEISNKPL